MIHFVFLFRRIRRCERGVLHSAPFPARHCRALKRCHPVRFLKNIVEKSMAKWVGAHPTPAQRTAGEKQADEQRADCADPHPCRSSRIRLAEPQLASLPRRARPRRRCGSVALPPPKRRARYRPPGWLPGYYQSVESNHSPLGLPWRKRRESNPHSSDPNSDAQPLSYFFKLRRPLIRPTHTVRWVALVRRTGIQNRYRCAATG